MESITKKIIGSKALTNKDRVKNSLYYVNRKRGAIKAWERRHKEVFHFNPEYNKSCGKDIENEHRNLWAPFRKKVDLSTIRICKSISGKADPRIIPEDLFVSDIEPSLLPNQLVHFLGHKSIYNHWFSNGLFPKDYFHCIDKQYLDQNLNPITFQELRKIAQDISYPVVLKANMDSYGGRNVCFVKSFDKLLELAQTMDDFVVQEKIEQHKFFNRYNPGGLNTIRVNVYKSVIDNQYHVISMALRMGRGGSLDNETAGGISGLIKNDGFLNNYAVDKYGTRFEEHPDTGIKFDDLIPNYEGLKKISIELSKKVFFARIIALDVCMDVKGKWRFIEINTHGITIRSSQYGGVPFFGEFTEEVIDYCIKNHWTVRLKK